MPDIPAYLCEILTSANQVVLDPFCGSGTTGIEAAKLGRRVLLSDSNRVAIELSLAKCALLSEPNLVEQLQSLSENIDPLFNATPVEIGLQSEELLKWYHPETLAKLRLLWSHISQTPDKCRAVGRMLFYEVLFDCSAPLLQTTASGKKRRHHWGWVADNVVPRVCGVYDVYHNFRQRIQHTISIIKFNNFGVSPIDVEVVRATADRLPFQNEVADAIITSPPYVSMIDYTLANRLVYYWNNWSYKEELASEIGARRFRNRTTALIDYLSQMESCFREMHRLLKPGGYCALVIGASRKHDDAVGLAINQLKNHFSVIWGPKKRESSRRRVADRLGRASGESIIILQK